MALNFRWSHTRPCPTRRRRAAGDDIDPYADADFAVAEADVPAAGTALAAALSNLPKLRSLGLRRAGLGPKGIAALCGGCGGGGGGGSGGAERGLGSLRDLQELRLGGNPIGACGRRQHAGPPGGEGLAIVKEGLRALGSALGRLARLQKLGIGYAVGWRRKGRSDVSGQESGRML
jgi:hypothetical protein